MQLTKLLLKNTRYHVLYLDSLQKSLSHPTSEFHEGEQQPFSCNKLTFGLLINYFPLQELCTTSLLNICQVILVSLNVFVINIQL